MQKWNQKSVEWLSTFLALCTALVPSLGAADPEIRARVIRTSTTLLVRSAPHEDGRAGERLAALPNGIPKNAVVSIDVQSLFAAISAPGARAGDRAALFQSRSCEDVKTAFSRFLARGQTSSDANTAHPYIKISYQIPGGAKVQGFVAADYLSASGFAWSCKDLYQAILKQLPDGRACGLECVWKQQQALKLIADLAAPIASLFEAGEVGELAAQSLASQSDALCPAPVISKPAIPPTLQSEALPNTPPVEVDRAISTLNDGRIFGTANPNDQLSHRDLDRLEFEESWALTQPRSFTNIHPPTVLDASPSDIIVRLKKTLYNEHNRPIGMEAVIDPETGLQEEIHEPSVNIKCDDPKFSFPNESGSACTRAGAHIAKRFYDDVFASGALESCIREVATGFPGLSGAENIRLGHLGIYHPRRQDNSSYHETANAMDLSTVRVGSVNFNHGTDFRARNRKWTHFWSPLINCLNDRRRTFLSTQNVKFELADGAAGAHWDHIHIQSTDHN